MNIIIFIIILLVLVVAHEFGHFFAAKRFGIRVDEFGFGFPPKLFGKKIGETEYTVNLLPIGGFVKIFGETPDEENMHGPDAARSFVNKPKWKQAIVLFAGVFANFLLAWLLFSFGFMSGLPTSVGSQPADYTLSDVHVVIVSVTPKSPADLAGLQSGDRIVSIKSGDSFTSYVSPETIQSFVVSGKPVEIEYLRGNEPGKVDITPAINGSGNPMIGIAMDQVGIAKLGILKALWEGMKVTINMTKETVVGLYTLIVQSVHGKGSFDSVTGVVGMVSLTGDAYKFGFFYLVSFAALISVNLSIINLLPIPALDGGRLFFLLIEKIKGSPIKPNVANTANTVGFILLMLLMLIVTYHEVAVKYGSTIVTFLKTIF